MISPQPRRRLTWSTWLLICAAGAGAYVGLARLGLMLASIHGNVSPVWPATGLSIWLLITFGRGLWPAILAGAFVANALTNVSLGVAATIAVGNTLEAVTGAWLWQWGQGRWRSMHELRELTGVLIASLVGPVASATVGVASLFLAGAVPLSVAGKLWRTWWTGDALGALTVFPALLAAPELGRLLRAASARLVGKTVVLLLVATAVSWFAFMTANGGVFLFAIFPVLLLAMTWLGAAGAKWTAVLIAAAGILAGYSGHGPFTTGEANQDFLNLQVFLAAVTVTAVVLPVFGLGQNSRWPVTVLLVGWTLSGWIFATSQLEAVKNQQALLSERIAATETRIKARMATYEEALRGGVSLMTASRSVSRAEWRDFAETLQLEKRFPGIDGIGVVFRVTAADKENFLRRVRADGAPGFTIHPVPGVVAPAVDEHYVITYLEPEALNDRAIGLDLASESNRLQAADRARDTGEPCMSGRIILVQDKLRRPGFLLCMPFYRKGAATNTVAERRAALEGWIDAPFITENFLQNVLGEQKEILQLHFFEEGGTDREHLLYATVGGEPKIPSRFDRVTAIELAGRRFQLGWQRGPKYPGVGVSAMVWVAASFALATLLLAGLVTSLQTFRQRAEELAAQRTAELERTQRVLESTNQLQRGVLDGTVFSVISTEPDGIIREFNTGAERMLGYTRAEMVGNRTPEVIHLGTEVAARAEELSVLLNRKIAPGFEAFVARTRLGEVDEREWTYVRKDGSRLPVQLSVTALRNTRGEITGFLGIARDLTARKQAEQAREYAHSLTRAAFESTADGILVVNREGKIDTYNQQFSSMWRVPDEVLESHDDARVIDCILDQLTDPGQFFGKIKELQDQPEAESMDTLLLKDGRVVERHSRPQRMRDRIVGRVWSFRDITLRHQTEMRLRTSEQRLQSVLGQADCILWEARVKLTETDWEWQFVYQPSGLFERLCGERLPSEGFAVWDRFHIPERAEMGQRCRDAFRTGQPGYQQEFHLIGNDQVVWLRENVSITKLSTGEFWLVGVIIDISERKQLEENLARSRDHALEASRLKSEFLATMSHEIRTPMNAVIGMAGLLADTPLNPKQEEMTRAIVGGAEHLLAIINDILDFSRIEAGRMRLDPVEFSFNHVLEETVRFLAPRAHEKQLELTCEIVPWSSALLLGDSGRVRQILTNLIGNAIKFTDRGEVNVVMQATREDAQRSRLHVAVRDTGVGIPRDAQGRIFQPFVQADGSSTRRFGGTGLGLAITQQLLGLMGGEIGFESEEGQGSRFWFELGFNHSGTALSEPPFGVLPGKRVLVVEDNETSRRILLAQLQHLGVEAEVVAGGEAALGRLTDAVAAPCDLVLLDGQMPGMSGIELARRIRSHPALGGIPLVLMASAGLLATKDELEPDFVGLLTKPVSETQLKQCLIRIVVHPAASDRPGTKAKRTKKRPGLRLLLVEDNLANQRVATLLLEKMGCEVDLAPNGLAGLQRLAGKDYQAVLMDCQMPVMDGYEATRHIRAGTFPGLNPRVPVIAMTAYAREEDRARCLAAGMDDYVSKPIRESELDAALERCGFRAATAQSDNEAEHEEAVFDLDALETTRSLPGMTGPSLLPEMVKLYLSDETERLVRLELLAEERQSNMLADEVHSFGGNAASFGASQVRRFALEVEEAARIQDWPAVAEKLTGLRAACARLRKEIIHLEIVTS